MAKKRTKKIPADILPALCEALARVAKKEGDREALVDGATYQITGRVIGDVNGFPVQLTFSGEETVDHATTRVKRECPKAEVWLAKLLSLVSPQVRQRIVDAMAKIPTAGDPPEDLSETAAEIMASLTMETTVPKAGAVKYVYEKP